MRRYDRYDRYDGYDGYDRYAGTQEEEAL